MKGSGSQFCSAVEHLTGYVEHFVDGKGAGEKTNLTGGIIAGGV